MTTPILGQDKALSYLAKLVSSQRVLGAFLFYGPEGVGKKQTALNFAKALNCLDAHARTEGKPCGQCAACKAIEKGTYPDVTLIDFTYQARLEIKKDFTSKGYAEELEKEIAKQQHLSISTIRQAAAKSQQKAVGTNGWKVLIIDQAQTMQNAAANALLKFIEEPPQKTVWILITNKRSAMLKTILSRCQPVPFSPLPEQHILQILNQNTLPVQQPELAARYSGGSVTGALAADKALALLTACDFTSPQGAIEIVSGLSHTLVSARQEAQGILDVLMQAIHRTWQQTDVVQEHKQYQQLLKRFENYKRSISRNVSPALVLETALMSLDNTHLSLQ